MIQSLTKIRDLVQEIDERNPPSSSIVFSVSEGHGIIPQTEIFTKQIATTDRSKYRRIQYGDVVFNPYLLWNRAVGVCFAKDGGCVSPAYPVLRPRHKGIERFLHYFFRSPILTGAVDSIASGSVTRRRTAPLSDILDLAFQLPSIEGQIAVNTLLALLDEKIEINRQINESLTAMSVAHYQFWFQQEPQKELKKGWKIKKLGDLADLNWGDTNTTKASYSNQGFPAYSAAGCDGLLPHYDFDRTGVVVSAIGAKSGTTWIALGKWSCIKNTIRFWAVDDSVSTEYLFVATYGKEKWPLRGSAQPFIAQGDARSLEILVPPDGLAKRFGEITRPIFEQIAFNNVESKTLAELRDALLPKLLSGELSVPAAGKDAD
jgi:restriction endonuclease S subunit